MSIEIKKFDLEEEVAKVPESVQPVVRELFKAADGLDDVYNEKKGQSDFSEYRNRVRKLKDDLIQTVSLPLIERDTQISSTKTPRAMRLMRDVTESALHNTSITLSVIRDGVDEMAKEKELTGDVNVLKAIGHLEDAQKIAIEQISQLQKNTGFGLGE